MDLLWITPKWPFPVADGARIASTQLIKNLTAQGIKIHLCSIVPDQEKIESDQAGSKLGVSQVTLIRRPRTTRLRQILGFLTRPLFPITLAPYAHPDVVEQLKLLFIKGDFDLVVYDGLHSAAWRLGNPQPKAKNFIEAYRAHNVESDIWFRGVQETKNIFKKMLFHFQGLLVKRVETKLVEESKFVFPVSLSDEAIFSGYPGHGRLHTLPIGIQVSLSLSSTQNEGIKNKGRNILFVGKLDWPPNREGLRWVLDHAWPKAKAEAPDLCLTIVGSGERNWLEAYRSLPGVRIVGQVENLAPYYDACIATLVPVFYGSGTRVKAIESCLYGRMCISTQIGVEGMGLLAGTHYCQVETAEEWIQALVNLETSRAFTMGNDARAYARTVFDPEVIARSFIQSVGQTTAVPISQ